MPAWFDLTTLDKLTSSSYDDEPGLLASVAAIDALIQAEVDAGIPENRIVVGGFSQGGAVAVLTALVTKRKLAGVAAMSTWVPLNHKVPQVRASDIKRDFVARRLMKRVDDESYGKRFADVLGTWEG